MKVIEPLFLNDLYEEYENAADSSKKLNALLNRIASLKIFDPACGSGNFLIIAYKELRRLEIKIFQKLKIGIPFSAISLTQFYGIEIDSFAVEIAQLSLWLAEHQMNVEFFQAFGKTNPTLPLKQAGHIVCANACRIDWEEVCSKGEQSEIFIFGNPPYLGFSQQNKKQKSDMSFVFEYFNSYKTLDYIAIWFKKATDFIEGTLSKFAFVTTNSINQGQQVSLLWPYILRKNVEIFFAHPSFQWRNNAKKNAGVIVAIIGLRHSEKTSKYLYKSGNCFEVNNINPYLLDSKNLFVEKRNVPLSFKDKMINGNKAVDGGNLIFQSKQEMQLFASKYPEATKYIRDLVGSNEYINRKHRWCLWIKDEDENAAQRISGIRDRIAKVVESRLASKDKSANLLAKIAYRFRDQRVCNTNSIFIPSVSSNRRKYIPLGYLDSQSVIVAPNFGMFDSDTFMFSILCSNFHMLWVRTVSGKLKSDYRYSSVLCYNTFPFPPISDGRKEELTTHTFRILEEREKHPEKTLAQLYDPDKMPDELREAHRLNDLAVERCYRSKPFESDEERLEYLFKLYEKMIQEEKERDTLFQREKKSRKKRK